jgi:hypothetical protein
MSILTESPGTDYNARTTSEHHICSRVRKCTAACCLSIIDLEVPAHSVCEVCFLVLCALCRVAFAECKNSAGSALQGPTLCRHVGCSITHMQCVHAGVQESVRPLKHDEVIQLRADTAREVNQVLLNYREVTRLISKLQANGV